MNRVSRSQVKTHSVSLNQTVNDDHRMKNLDSDSDELNRDHSHNLPHQALLHMHQQRFMVADIKAEPRMTD